MVEDGVGFTLNVLHGEGWYWLYAECAAWWMEDGIGFTLTVLQGGGWYWLSLKCLGIAV